MPPKAKAKAGLAKSVARRQASPSVREAGPAHASGVGPAGAFAGVDQQEPTPAPPPIERSVSSSVVDCFRRFDLHGEGKISREELGVILNKLNPELDCEKVFEAMDRNKDSLIDYSEFVDWVYDAGDYGKDGSDARALVGMAPGFESPQEQLDRCLQEVAECEKDLAAMKPEEFWIESGEAIGVRLGNGGERRANIVVKVDKAGVAARAGVQAGWQICEISWSGERRTVIGTTYVPDLVMEGKRFGSVCVKLLSNEELERQRAAEFRLPELLAALDIAKKRQANAAQPLKYSAPKPAPTPAPPSAAEAQPAPKEDAKPADAFAALAKYEEEKPSYAPSYAELQAAMGQEDWTKYYGSGKLMNPDEWFEHMGLTNVGQADPYKILGIDADASQEELKIAFRELAREFHPDKYPDDPETANKRFDLIKKAYDRVRTEDARAKTDSQLGVTDFFSLYMSEDREGRKRMMLQTALMIKDDPNALPREAGMDDELKAQGCVVVKYSHYKLPFKVPEGRLAIADIDALYCLTDIFPGCTFLLAEWRPGDCHILRPGDEDSGESAIMRQEGGSFCDLRPGMNYHLLVQEK